MNLRSRPAVLAVIGVVATLVLALIVVIALLQTEAGTKAVSDNAALIGAVVGLGGIFTAQMVSSALEDRRAQEARDIEADRTRETRSIEAQRAQENAQQKYFEQIGQLLLEKDVINPEVRTLLRAQTLVVLAGLADPARKRVVLQFLYEMGLIIKNRSFVDLLGADLSEADLNGLNLSETDLSEVDLSEAYLRGANLSEVDLNGANLRGADLSIVLLSEADLMAANLSKAYLRGANVMRADLSTANLSGADLSGANLREANLSFSDLSGANLRDAVLRAADLSSGNVSKVDLGGADLSEADLSGADLSGANLRRADLRDAILDNATMPNGQNYNEWLETPEGQQWHKTYEAGRGEDGEIAATEIPINVAYPTADELHLRIALAACRFEVRPSEAKRWIVGACHDPTGKRVPIIRTEGGLATITEELSYERISAVLEGVPRYELKLGKERSFALTIEAGTGEFNLDLGGVPLKSLTVKQRVGRFNLAFSAPNPELMSRLEISSATARIELENLANANFSKMRLFGEAVGFELDFGGRLLRDAEAKIETSLNSVEIAVPASTAARIIAEPNFGTSVDVGDGFTKRQGTFWTEAGLAWKKPLLTIRAGVRLGALQIRAT